MTIKIDAGGPVEAEAEAVAADAALDAASVDEIKAAAETYRAAKEQAPEVSAATKAQQLHQAAGDLAYYTQLVNERQAQIKRLTAELDDGTDASLAAISAIVNKG